MQLSVISHNKVRGGSKGRGEGGSKRGRGLGEKQKKGKQVVCGVSCCRSCGVMCNWPEQSRTEIAHLALWPIPSRSQISCDFQ